MKKIKLTQGQVALVDDIDFEYLSQWKWCADRHRKCFRPLRKSPRVNGKRETIYIYTVIAERMGIDASRIDHKDQNPLNNQRKNLRAATHSQNLHNCGASKNSTTGVKGVWFHKARGKYVAEIRVEGKLYWLGRFDILAEAAVVVQKKREELVGEFACH